MGNCPAEGPQFEAPDFLFHFCLFQWWSQRSNYVATVMAICLACKESSAGCRRPRQKPAAACRLWSQHQSSEQEKRTIACSSGLMVLNYWKDLTWASENGIKPSKFLLPGRGEVLKLVMAQTRVGGGREKWSLGLVQTLLEIHPKSLPASVLTEWVFILFRFLPLPPHDSLVNPTQGSSVLVVRSPSLVAQLGQAYDPAGHWGEGLENSGEGFITILKVKLKKRWPLFFLWMSSCLDVMPGTPAAILWPWEKAAEGQIGTASGREARWKNPHPWNIFESLN